MRLIKDPHEVYGTDEFIAAKQRLIQEKIKLDKNGELLCDMCNKPILKSWDTICHHIVEINFQNMNDINITINPKNLQIVHRKCHDLHHNRFGAWHQKVIFVYGNVASGKTTYVRENATKDDIILDLDNIWQAISINERYIKPNRLKPVVFALRECLMEQIKMRNGKWVNAWVLSTAARCMDRKRIIDSIGADEVIHIDTPMEECLKNLRKDETRINVLNEYENYIREYDKNFQEDELIHY